MTLRICNCGAAVEGEVTVRGRKVRFEFSHRFGPLVLDLDGEPKEKQPISERDPFWLPFSAWLATHERLAGARKPLVEGS